MIPVLIVAGVIWFVISFLIFCAVASDDAEIAIGMAIVWPIKLLQLTCTGVIKAYRLPND